MSFHFLGQGPEDVRLAQELVLSGLVFLISGVQGAILAGRFRVLALLPFCCLNAAIIAFLWAVARSHDVGLLIEEMLVSGVAIQLGYLADQIGFHNLKLR